MDLPLHRRLADDLRARILRGDLAVDASLPSEAALCEQWNTSRGTVRHALSVLRSEGLIGGGRGRPPVVRGRHLSQPFDTFLSFSTWAHDLGREPGQRTLELARRPARQVVADALDLDEGTPVIEVLRLRLLDGRPTMLERTSFPEPVGRLLFDADPDAGSIHALLRANGVSLENAKHVFDAVAADALDAELLDVASGAPLLRERRRTSTAHGDPVEYSDDRYRPDLVTFTVENAQQTMPSMLRTTR